MATPVTAPMEPLAPERARRYGLRYIRPCAIALALIAGALALDSCGPRNTSGTAERAELRRGIGGEPASLDPQRSGDTFSFEVLRDLFEGLTAELPSGETIPAVAENWSVSLDGLTFRFALRADARWSNGDILSAEDFVAALQRAVDPATASPQAELLSLIRGAPEAIAGKAPASSIAVRADGPRTLRVELATPAPYFPSILANPVAYPRHHDAGATTPGAAPGRLVSNGAYRLAEWVPGGKLRLVRNESYWDRAHVAIPEVRYVPIADSNAELTRYRAGELDLTSSVPTTQVESLRRERPAELQVRPQLAVIYYAFNLERAPFKDAPGLREALSLVIDRERLVADVLAAGQVAAYGFVPPGIPGYEPVSVPWRGLPMPQRLAEARALYRAAGYGATRPLRCRLVLPADDTLRRVAITVASMWHEALGVEASVVDMEYRAFLATRNDAASWDVRSHGWNADYPDPGNFLGVFVSTSAQNDSHLRDAEFDRRMAEAMRDPDGARRLQSLAAAEQRLLATQAIIPLYYPVARRLVQPRIAGAILGPMDHNYSKYLSFRSP